MYTYIIAYKSVHNDNVLTQDIIAPTVEDAVYIFDKILKAKDRIIAVTEKKW